MRTRDDLRAIGDLAGTQRGLVTRRQISELGHRSNRIDVLVAQRWLRPVHPGVYSVGHDVLTREGRWLAAVLAIAGSVLSHRCAAVLWGILTAAALRIDVTLTSSTGHDPRSVIVPHRRRIANDERTVVRGIPCTSLARTILDLAASEPRHVLADAFEEAQVRHRLQPAEVAEALVVRRGHRGTARVRELLLDAVDPGEVQSRLEIRFLKFCRDAGLPRPDTQRWIAGWPVDFHFADVDLAVETDGDRFHASAAKRERDRRKTADVEAAGTPVLRLRWVDIVDDPATTRSTVLAARDAAAARA